MTSTADILKLKNVGDGVTFRVTACQPMKIGTYPEVEFTGVDATGRLCAVRVPQKSADRQLERLELSYDAAVGQTLTISRSPNAQVPAKPFWDCVLADAPIDAPQRIANANGQSPTTTAPAMTATSATNGHAPEKGRPSKHGAALYLEITEFTLEKVVPLYVRRGIPVTADAAAAMTATLFIEACRR